MEVTQEQLHEMVQSEVNAAIAAKSLAPVKAKNTAWMELKNDISKFVNGSTVRTQKLIHCQTQLKRSLDSI